MSGFYCEWESICYNDKRIKQSELLQLILLDNLYAESGSERIVFQGGTALRWIYGGRRFLEDLDFVTDLSKKELDKTLTRPFRNTQKACIAQVSPGQSEYKEKGDRKQATRIFFIYRPQEQRERIAVKLEFESLKTGKELIDEYGPDAELGKILFDRYRLSLKTTIFKEHGINDDVIYYACPFLVRPSA